MNRSPAKHYRFISLVKQAEAEAWRRVLLKYMRMKERIVRRILARDERRIRLKALAPPKPKPVKPPAKKISAHEILAEVANRKAGPLERGNPETASLRRAARQTGIPMKQLRRIWGILSEVQLEQLITEGYLSLPRVGRLDLVESPERIRQINIEGRIGRDGKVGPRRFPAFVRVRFTASRALKAALRIGSDLGVLARPKALRDSLAFPPADY